MELRLQLTRQGLDAGPVTIAWHLEQAGHRVPSTSTIRRILHTAELINPEPRKRPRSSYRRFEAAQPNECWQSDFTHWRLADNTDTEILNWLDDHSRYLLSCTAHTPVTGDTVVNEFLTTANTHGLPASTLTDNGRVYTARFGGGKNAFEYLLTALGITQKNGSGGHPQTQGKVERLHQTQKRWLAQQPPAATLAQLQTQLDGSATSTTTSDPTVPSTAAHQQPPTPRYPRPAPPSTHPARFTTGCATTPSTPGAKSASDAPAGCTTSVSDTPTAAPRSSPSPTKPPQP